MNCVFGCEQSKGEFLTLLLNALIVAKVFRGKSAKRYQIRLAELKNDPQFYRCKKCAAGNLRIQTSPKQVCLECDSSSCLQCGQEVYAR